MTSKKNFNPIWIEVHITAADRNRTGTGITTHGILSPYIPCELPGTCWYVLEFKVSKNAVKIGLFVLRQTKIL